MSEIFLDMVGSSLKSLYKAASLWLVGGTTICRWLARIIVKLHYSIFQKMSDGNLRPSRGIHVPLVPNFPLGTFQSEQNVSSSLVYTMHSPLLVGPPFQRFDSSIRPLPSASLPGESSGIFTSRQPFYIRLKTKMSTSFSSDSESRSQRRDKFGASVDSLTSQLSSESKGLPPNLTSPIILEGTVREQIKSKPILSP